MNKKELISRVAEQAQVSQKSVSQLVDAVFDTIKANLERCEPVTVRGFGTFAVKEWAERRGVNPVTLKPMIIPARKMIKFVPSPSNCVKTAAVDGLVD